MLSEEHEKAIDGLRYDIDNARTSDIMQFFVEHLALWGPFGIDVQAMAKRIFDRMEEEN